MDEDALGPIVISLIVLGALIVAGGAWIGIFWANDGVVEATIIDTDCATPPLGSSSTVTVQTRAPIPGIEHTLTGFDDQQCGLLRPGEDGNYVEYYVKSGRTVLYEREGGSCIYDSESGLGC